MFTRAILLICPFPVPAKPPSRHDQAQPPSLETHGNEVWYPKTRSTIQFILERAEKPGFYVAEFDNQPPLIFPDFDTITDDQCLHGHATSAQRVPYRLPRPSANLGPGVATEDRDVEDQEYIAEAGSSYKLIHIASVFLASKLSAIDKTLLTSRVFDLSFPIWPGPETRGTKVINSPTSPGSKMPSSSSSKCIAKHSRTHGRAYKHFNSLRVLSAGIATATIVYLHRASMFADTLNQNGSGRMTPRY